MMSLVRFLLLVCAILSSLAVTQLGIVSTLLAVHPPARMLILDDIICDPPAAQNGSNSSQTSASSTTKRLQDFCSNKNFSVVVRGTPFPAHNPLSSAGLTPAMASQSNLTNLYRVKVIVEDFTARPPINKEILDNTLASFNPVQRNDSGTRTWTVTIPDSTLPQELNCTVAFVHVVLYQDKAMVTNLSSNQLLHPHFPLPGVRDVMSIALPISGVQCGVELVGNAPPTDLALQGQGNTSFIGLDAWIASNIFPEMPDDEDSDEEDDEGPVYQPLLFGSNGRRKRSPQFGNRPPPPQGGQRGQQPPPGNSGPPAHRPNNASRNFSSGFPPPPPGGNFSGRLNGSFNGTFMPPMLGNMSANMTAAGMFPPAMGMPGMMGGGNMTGMRPPPPGAFGNMSGNFSFPGMMGPMGNQSGNGSMPFRPPPPQQSGSSIRNNGPMAAGGRPGPGGPPGGGARAFAAGSLEGRPGMDNRTINGSMPRPPMDNRTMNGSRMPPPRGPPTGQRGNGGPSNSSQGSMNQVPPRGNNGGAAGNNSSVPPRPGQQQSQRGGDSPRGDKSRGFASFGTSGSFGQQSMNFFPTYQNGAYNNMGPMEQQGGSSQRPGGSDEGFIAEVKENLQALSIPVYRTAEEFFASRTMNISLENLGPSASQSRNLLGAVSVMAYIRRLTPRTLRMYEDAPERGGNGSKWIAFSEGDIFLEANLTKLLNGRDPNALPVGGVVPLNLTGSRLPGFVCGPLLLIVELFTFADKNTSNNWFQQPFFLECNPTSGGGEKEKPCQPMLGPIMPGTSRPAGLYVRSNMGPARDPDFTAIRFEPEMAETNFQSLPMGDKERRMAVTHDARVRAWMLTLANHSMCNEFLDEPNAMNFPAAAVLFIDAVNSALQNMTGISNELSSRVRNESNSTQAFKRFMELAQDRRCPERVRAFDGFIKNVLKGTMEPSRDDNQPQNGAPIPAAVGQPQEQSSNAAGMEEIAKAIVESLQNLAQSGGDDTRCVLQPNDKQAIQNLAAKITPNNDPPMIMGLFFSTLAWLNGAVENGQAVNLARPDINDEVLVPSIAGVLLQNQSLANNNEDFVAIVEAVNASNVPDATLNLMHLLWWSRHDWQFVGYGKRNNNGSGVIGNFGNDSDPMEICYQKAQLLSRLLQIGKIRNFRTRMLWKSENGLIHAGSYSTLMSDIFWVPIFACSCQTGGCGQTGPSNACGRGRGDGRMPMNWNTQEPMSGNLMSLFGNGRMPAGQGSNLMNVLSQLSTFLSQLNPSQQSQVIQLAMALAPTLLASGAGNFLGQTGQQQQGGLDPNQLQQQLLMASLMGQSQGVPNADYVRQMLTQIQTGAAAGNSDAQRALQNIQTAMAQQAQAMQNTFPGYSSTGDAQNQQLTQMLAQLGPLINAMMPASAGGYSQPTPIQGVNPSAAPTMSSAGLENLMKMVQSSGMFGQTGMPAGTSGDLSGDKAMQDAANQLMNNLNLLLG